jgi:hypothetical protein
MTTTSCYLTKRFCALDHDFAIETTDPALGRYLDSLLEPFGAEGLPEASYAFTDRGTPAEDRYELYFRDTRLIWAATPGIVFDYLLWHINSRVVSESTRYLLVHDSAAELDGRAIVMPADAGSGKTTLVAGLLRAGLRYLTDEAVAIDCDTLQIEPFPKPLSVDEGSWPILPELAPALGPDLQSYARNQWAVDARSVRPDVLAPRSRPAFVVSPCYRAHAPTRLVALRPAETVALLARHSFNLQKHGQPGLEALAAIARRSAGYRLEMGDLDAACRLIVDLMTAEPTGGVDGRGD